MPLLYTFQAARRDDGQLPYPLHALANGEIQQKGFWKDTMVTLVGFSHTGKADEGHFYRWLDMHDPEQAVGKYIVYADAEGKRYVFDSPVASVDVRMFSDEQLEHLNR